MASRKHSAPAVEEPIKAAIEEDVEATLLPGTVVPASPVGTPGYYMGISSRPETAEEHATRLGDAAGTSTDIGWMLGSLEPRAEWPGPPPVVEEPEEP